MKILHWPDPTLKQVSEPVLEPLNMEFVNAMYDTMVQSGGIGLAAIQVGLPKRFFIMEHYGTPKVIVNPVILTYLDNPEPMKEGCLSIPNHFENIKRFTKIEVKYWPADLSHEIHEVMYGQDAHVFQHEYEHLDGKLFVDKLPAAKRSTIRGNLAKLKKWGKI